MIDGAIAAIAQIVPVHDYVAAQTLALYMLYAQIGLCTLGALSWAFTGILQVSFGEAVQVDISLTPC